MAKIKVKNSTSAGSVPSGLSAGEIAVNLTDRKLFVGTSDVSGSIFPFLPGVSSIAAGSGISLANGKTQGDVTIINAGVTSIFGLTGIVGLTGTDGITLSVSGRTLTIQGPGAGSGSGFTYYNGITAFSFGFRLKGGPLVSADIAKFYLSSTPAPGPRYLVNLTKVAANNNNTNTTNADLSGMLARSDITPTLHCVNERTKRVLVIRPLNNASMSLNTSTQQLSMDYETFTGQSYSDFDTNSSGVSGDWITIHFTLTPTTPFAFLGDGGLSATSSTTEILTDGDGVTHAVSYKEVFIDPTNIADIAGASTIDETNDGFIFYDINATGNKLRKTTFKKAVLDSADTLFTTRTSSQILKDKSSTSVIYDVITAATITNSDNGLLTGATAFKYLEANTVKSLNGNTGHVAIDFVNSINGSTGIIGICGGDGIEDITVGRTLTLSLEASGVVAGSTGYSNRIPIITVDTYGRVTGLTSIGNIEAYDVRTQDLSTDNDFAIGFVTGAPTSASAIFRDPAFTFNPSSNKIGLPGFTLTYSSSSKIVSSSNVSGGNKNLTINPYGDIILKPENANSVLGSLPILSILNSSGLVSLTGGDFYIGVKDEGLGDVAGNIIFEGSTDDGNETTLTIIDPTADRTITLPNDSGTVALTKNIVTSFNGLCGAIQGVSSINGATGVIVNVAKTNEGNTFTSRQVLNAGATLSELYVSGGATFGGTITANSISTSSTISGSNLVFESINETEIVPGVLYTGGELNVNAKNKIAFTVGNGSNTVPYPILSFTNSNLNSAADITFTALGGDIEMSAGGGIVFNPVSYINMAEGVLYVDDTNNRVGVNKTNPAYPLDVLGTANFDSGITCAGATFSSSINLLGSLLINGNNGTNNQVLSSTGSGITWSTVSGGSKTYSVFVPTDNQPPASNYATIDTRNSIMVLEFDAATDESAVFVGVIPEAASLGSGLKVRIHWMADTATTGTCRWGVQIERMNTDEDSDSFDTAATAGSTTNVTSGIITTTEITITTIDSVTAGEPYRLKVFRDADGTSGTDDMTGDAQLVAVEVRSAS